MESFCSGSNAQAKMAAQVAAQSQCEKPETALAELFKRDLGIEVNPQALRLFIRWRFDKLSPLAHKIHRGD